MFVNAIESVANYTRAVHTISRNYSSEVIQPGAATLFFVNDEGWALTAGHVADLLRGQEQLAKKCAEFRKELATNRGTTKEKKLIKELEKKYGYSKRSTFEIYSRFINCVDGMKGFEIIRHMEYDVALIKFVGFSQLGCSEFAVFAKEGDNLKQGKMLCRLGFPFPEFTNFEYNNESDGIGWTKTGRVSTPRFPIEGMVTRHLLDKEGKAFGFEMSTPGLRGQSGGPAFDVEGKIWGMQFATGHLDLNFDVDQEVLRQGTKQRIKDSAFLHVGACIHVDVLKVFMKEHNVSFAEA